MLQNIFWWCNFLKNNDSFIFIWFSNLFFSIWLKFTFINFVSICLLWFFHYFFRLIFNLDSLFIAKLPFVILGYRFCLRFLNWSIWLLWLLGILTCWCLLFFLRLVDFWFWNWFGLYCLLLRINFFLCQTLINWSFFLVNYQILLFLAVYLINRSRSFSSLFFVNYISFGFKGVFWRFVCIFFFFNLFKRILLLNFLLLLLFSGLFFFFDKF